jgi:hypothetical protein
MSGPIFMGGADAPQPAADAESGDAKSEAKPEAAACSPGGGQRRRTAGESEERPMSPRACRTLREARGHADSAQRGVPSWRSESVQRRGRPLPRFAPLRRSAPVDAVRHATQRVSHLRKSKPYAQR